VVDAVIASLGRRLNLDGLGLKEIGVALDEHGLPPFDPGTLRIPGFEISIAGDVNGMRPLLHEAADEGYIAGYNALRDTSECFVRRVPLGIVFCDPNIATVGQRCKELDQDQAVVGEVDLKGQGRLRMEGADPGPDPALRRRPTGPPARCRTVLPARRAPGPFTGPGDPAGAHGAGVAAHAVLSPRGGRRFAQRAA
jgi:hypothetical protein